MRTAEDVLNFWFVEHGREHWFGGGPSFDAEIAKQFGETHAHVALGEAWRWRATPDGRLAEIIVLDQFSRQLFRGQAQAFATDRMALVLAQEMVAQGLDAAIDMPRKMFIYLPYMHSESLAIHEVAMQLHEPLGEEAMKFETGHRDCIARFGRYPFRNKAMGRDSTPEELAYMAEAGDRVF